MRKLALSIGCLVISTCARAQVRCEAYMPSFFIDADLTAGVVNEKIQSPSPALNYTDAVNSSAARLAFRNGTSAGANLTFGYYINRKRSLGIGIGLMVSRQSGDLSLDTFHTEFKSYDYKGNVFRQLISSDHPIVEQITATGISIPLLLRYKKDISEKVFLSVDGGLVYNIKQQSSWSTNANFNYEAVYDFTGTGNNPGTVYDNGTILNKNDLIWTQAAVEKENPGENINSFFATRNAAGYSIGLNESVNKSSGTTHFYTASLGYTFNAVLNIRIARKVYFRVGGYYLAQEFNNSSANASLPITNQIIRNSQGQDIGVNYNPLISTVQHTQNAAYGIILGVKVYLSRRSLLDFQ